MHDMVEIFLHYGYLVLFGWVLVEQMGLPLPSTPILLLAGTLSATHAMSLPAILIAVLAGSLIADSVWFSLGERYGGRVTRWICKFSLEAASCVRKTEDMLTRRGGRALLVAKFVPGLNTMAAPLAGQSQMRYRDFLLYDAAGTLLWAASFVLAGRFFGVAIRRNELLLAWMGRSALALVALLVIGLIAYRIIRQQRFLHQIRTLRLEPEQLKAMLDHGENVYIVDLRHPLDFLPDPRTLPGAVQLMPNELIERSAEIPRDRDIIVFCTCPSEATSAKVALTMRRLGIERIRPLRGGVEGWKDRGYPLVDIVPPRPIDSVALTLNS